GVPARETQHLAPGRKTGMRGEQLVADTLNDPLAFGEHAPALVLGAEQARARRAPPEDVGQFYRQSQEAVTRFEPEGAGGVAVEREDPSLCDEVELRAVSLARNAHTRLGGRELRA